MMQPRNAPELTETAKFAPNDTKTVLRHARQDIAARQTTEIKRRHNLFAQ